MSGRAMSGAAAVLTGAVRAYQWTIRPIIGAQCRFEPSCSHYAIEALAVHGAARGTALTARRVLRCNPWHEGGFDPVPPPQHLRQGRAS
jgi:putative membrane protein insertion efficiency factor